jgi:hypothetical protein
MRWGGQLAGKKKQKETPLPALDQDGVRKAYYKGYGTYK